MIVDHSWTLDALVEAYKEYQRRTRGLREPTLHGYEWCVRVFVRAALGDDPIDPARLGCSDVVEFIASMTDRFCAGVDEDGAHGAGIVLPVSAGRGAVRPTA